MAILPAQDIRTLSKHPAPDGRPGLVPYDLPTRDLHWWHEGRVLITPYAERTRYQGKTFGLGPAGYDLRVAETFWLFPFWGRLASSIEEFDVPRDLTFTVNDKSSWARSFVFAMNTNGEPGWRGFLTLELVRFLPWPIKIRAGGPIANIMFSQLRSCTELPYEGKYQDQEAGPQAARQDSADPPPEGWITFFVEMAGLARAAVRRWYDGL